MKRVSFNLVSLLIISHLLITFLIGPGYADSAQNWSGLRPPNCKCHSKNIKMVEMHKPFGVKDCSVCHQKPVSKQAMKEKEDKDSKMDRAQQRRREEKICKGCHVLKKAINGGSSGN